MTLHVLPDLEQGSEDWFNQRRGLVTASVIGQLLSVRAPGADAYECTDCGAPANGPCVSKAKGKEGTPISTIHAARTALAAAKAREVPPIIEVANDQTSQGLTRLLTAERVTGWTDPTFTSDDMFRGIEDEPRARDAYSKSENVPVTTVGLMVREERGWKLGFSPDGLVGDNGLIEIKSRRAKKHLQTVLSNKVPAENMPQLMAGLLVSGRKWIDYVSYCGGMPLWVQRVYPDQRWFDAIIAAVTTFEQASEDMASRYFDAVSGLPKTERVVELEMVI
ncbi:lambda exonuclease family protein [Nocardioides sp. NPDC101246]|uniref:lambda exonuclease family protein n=1 Tax=Nocardioides sp. NPDC101246 TaxID=3364336 RepID=UPI0037F184B1